MQKEKKPRTAFPSVVCAASWEPGRASSAQAGRWSLTRPGNRASSGRSPATAPRSRPPPPAPGGPTCALLRAVRPSLLPDSAPTAVEALPFVSRPEFSAKRCAPARPLAHWDV